MVDLICILGRRTKDHRVFSQHRRGLACPGWHSSSTDKNPLKYCRPMKPSLPAPFSPSSFTCKLIWCVTRYNSSSLGRRTSRVIRRNTIINLVDAQTYQRLVGHDPRVIGGQRHLAALVPNGQSVLGHDITISIGLARFKGGCQAKLVLGNVEIVLHVLLCNLASRVLVRAASRTSSALCDTAAASHMAIERLMLSLFACVILHCLYT